MGTHRVPSVSTRHRIERGLWWQDRPRRSAWPSAAAQPKDTDMASGGSASHSQQHGPQQLQQHSPRMSAWVQASVRTTDTCTAFAGSTGCGHPHRSRLQEDDGPRHGPKSKTLNSPVFFSFPPLSHSCFFFPFSLLLPSLPPFLLSGQKLENIFSEYSHTQLLFLLPEDRTISQGGQLSTTLTHE